jgi:UTP-glucose-1-phosphate uridylyltransferase/mevalonate kinase
MPRHETFFVPGRLCLVGEHSDTSGGLRGTHPSLAVGHALVASTREGLSVTASRRADATLTLSSAVGGDLSLAPPDLLPAARGAGPWRYAAGVAYVVCNRWGVSGLGLNVDSDLPTAKGLSSSAALCVAVSRAFNRLYALGLTAPGEMDLAYAGERLTGSMCGRMDQCVALGSGAVAHMTFDGEVTTHRVLRTSTAPIWIVFVDLEAAKNTPVILRDLQAAVTRGATAEDKKLIEALGSRNEGLVGRACEALEAGDARCLGALYREAQELFDASAMPLCPDQLTAPRLHEVMAHPSLQPFIYGAKGVGSQGDGTVQFVARGAKDASQLILALHALGLPSTHTLEIGNESSGKCNGVAAAPRMEVDKLPVARSVKTAVITAAGFGTRLFPASRSIRPKSLMPIVDSDGFVKPLLLYIVELCVLEGMEQVVIVSGPSDVERVRELFSAPEPGLAKAIAKKKHIAEYAERIAALADKIKIVVQDTPEGFGHAVSRASEHLESDEAFALLLGDVVFKVPQNVSSCLRQCLDIFERDPQSRSVLGVSDVSLEEAGAYGVILAQDDDDVPALKVLDFVEKPDREQAIALASDGICKIVLGPYVFTRKVMDALLADVAADARLSGEVQLTPAVARVMDEDGLLAVSLVGQSLDTGNPQEYASTMVELASYVL